MYKRLGRKADNIRKKKVCTLVPEDLFQEVNLVLVKKHGNCFGYFTKTVEEALKMWLKKQDMEHNI